MTTRRAMILGLTGAPGVGKDTIADLLYLHDGWQRVAFADALRVEVATCWDVGCDTFTNPRTKNEPRMALAANRCTNHTGAEAAWIDWCVGMVTSSSCTRGQRWCSVASRAGRRLAAVLSIEAIRRRPCGSRGCTAWRASAARRRMSSA